MILVTGGIGAGKSVVCRVLRLSGFPVFDCDYEARRIMDSSAAIKDFLNAEISTEIIDENGDVRKDKLRAEIFADEVKREKLNHVVHQGVRDKLREFISENGADCFVESAIPHTGRLLQFADEVWIVDAPREVRISRVVERNGLSEREIVKIMETQQAEFDEVKKSGIPYRMIFNDLNHDLSNEIFANLKKKN